MPVLNKAEQLAAAMKLSGLVRADDDAALARFASTQLSGGAPRIETLRLAREVLNLVARQLEAPDEDAFARLVAAHAQLAGLPVSEEPNTDNSARVSPDQPGAPWASPEASSAWVEPGAPTVHHPYVTAPTTPPMAQPTTPPMTQPTTGPMAQPSRHQSPVAHSPSSEVAASTQPTPMKVDPDGATIDAASISASPALPFRGEEPAPAIPPLKISPDGTTLVSEQGPTGPALPFAGESED